MEVEDPNDIEAVYRRYITMVRRQARRIVGESAAAEDVAQDVFFKFFQHRAKQESPTHLSAFLFRMTTNTALNHLRKHRRIVSKPVLDENAPAEDPSTLVRESLTFCDPVVADIAARHFLANLSQDDIAAELKLSRHAVREHLAAFIQATRKGWRES